MTQSTTHQHHVPLGTTRLARDQFGEFLISPDDLNEHFYIIGRSGTGKSNLLHQLALADARRGAGLCLIDPIGSTAESVAAALSRQCATDASRRDRTAQGVATRRGEEGTGDRDNDGHSGTGDSNANRDSGRGSCKDSRDTDQTDHRDSDRNDDRDQSAGGEEAFAPRSEKDIIYIDVADTDRPIGINPLYDVAPEDRARTVSDILNMFEGIWHDTGWGPRMESIFRAALLTLVENPNVMRPSLLTVFRLLLDPAFREDVTAGINNPQVIDWWQMRFDRGDLNERTRREWVEPVLNKIDTMSLDPTIRHIVGQPRCLLDFDKIVSGQQMLIVNLNQNRIGADNAAFIGMLIVSRIRQACAKRGRRDRPFAITLDEAHTFPTVELTNIINQGRHDGLFARIAHQNLEQFDPKIASTLRNGCGSLAVFAIGNRDAEIIVDDMEAQFRDRCKRMINRLQRGECMLRLTQDGAPQPAPSHPVMIDRDEGSSASSRQKRLDSLRRFSSERFGIDQLRVEFQIANSNGALSGEEIDHWRRQFDDEKDQRAREHKANARVRRENRVAHQSEAFGGAANDLQRIGQELFGRSSRLADGNEGFTANPSSL